MGSADGPRAATATEHLNGEGPVLKVEPDGRPSALKPLSGMYGAYLQTYVVLFPFPVFQCFAPPPPFYLYMYT